jgi:hypothetical protein
VGLVAAGGLMLNRNNVTRGELGEHREDGVVRASLVGDDPTNGDGLD